jgi:hypothetical protein
MSPNRRKHHRDGDKARLGMGQKSMTTSRRYARATEHGDSHVPYKRNTAAISMASDKSAHLVRFRFDSMTPLTMFRAPPADERCASHA